MKDDLFRKITFWLSRNLYDPVRNKISPKRFGSLQAVEISIQPKSGLSKLSSFTFSPCLFFLVAEISFSPHFFQKPRQTGCFSIFYIESCRHGFSLCRFSALGSEGFQRTSRFCAIWVCPFGNKSFKGFSNYFKHLQKSLR